MSQRVEIERVARFLSLDEDTLFGKLVEWSDNLPFKIDMPKNEKEYRRIYQKIHRYHPNHKKIKRMLKLENIAFTCI